jgi:protein subunit release factor B
MLAGVLFDQPTNAINRNFTMFRIKTRAEQVLFSACGFWRTFGSMVKPSALQFSFARSSGPGGQNVNKVNTKVDCRFVLCEASWLAPLERAALKATFPNRVNKKGEFVVVSTQSRSQAENRQDCIAKLQDCIDECEYGVHWEAEGSPSTMPAKKKKKKKKTPAKRVVPVQSSRRRGDPFKQTSKPVR